MRVLISAYACEPGAGSEPGAGWAWTRAAALAGHEVWVVTRENNKAAIDAALAAEPELGIAPVYIDLPDRLRRWKRGQRGVRLYYVMWQGLARYRMSRLHRRIRFDVSHHLTFAVDWLPAAAVGLKNLPSIWGPVGGAGSIPVGLYRWIGPRGVLQELLREVIVRSLRRFFGSFSARRAALVVAQNDDVARRFERAASRIVVQPNVAVAREVAPAERGTEGANHRVALFVGRLIPLKGLRLAIAAMAEMSGDWVLEVIGDGPERDQSVRLAASLGLASRIRFLGVLPRGVVLSRMAEADVLVLPSMHDSAGWVVGEAATTGTPTVCLNLGGPATMARLGGGLVVEARGDVVGALARAIGEAPTIDVDRDAWSEDRLPPLLDSWYRYAKDAKRDSRELR